MYQPLRWLHLSDLHLGAHNTQHWMARTLSVLREALPKVCERRGGVPDLVLMSGDLAYSGDEPEYQTLDGFLDQLDAICGKRLPLVPVPGNHDVRRPSGQRALRFLDSYKDGLDDADVLEFKEALWVNGDAGDLQPLFAPYMAWLKRTVLGRADAHHLRITLSPFFPGDVLAAIALPDKPPLTVVGLNTAWLHWRAGAAHEFRGRLALRLEQLSGLLEQVSPGAPDAALAGSTNVLMMHHPRDWLSDAAHETLLSSLYDPAHFDACLCGHMHRPWQEVVISSAGTTHRFFQAPSLFGLKHCGTQETARLNDFVWGELGLHEGIRVWPYKVASGNRFIFDADHFDERRRDSGIQLKLGTSPSTNTVPGDDIEAAAPLSDSHPSNDVFISYAREDASYAQWVFELCTQLGLRAFKDDESLRGGEPFRDGIEQAIHAAHRVLVLWSEVSITSPWVKAEADRARIKGN